MKLTPPLLVASRIAIVVAAVTLLESVDGSRAVADDVIQPSPMAQMLSGLNPANWKMPNFKSLLPGKEEKTRIKQKKDGLLSEVTQTASSSWTKTKQVFNPQKLNPINYFPASARTPSSNQPEPQPGFFRSMFFPPSEPVKENETVTDFLRQSRPTP